jgi:phage tail-like protein
MLDLPLIPSFHFLVTFELPQLPGDMNFQEVTGLSVEAQYDVIKAGGQNAFEYRLPLRPRYSDLVLKRGYTMISGITAWMIEAFENYNYKPTNLIITLLNEEHIPLSAWYVVNALPVKWELSPFNAEDSKIVIESMTLRYDYFKSLSLSSLAAAALDLLPSVSASANISFP